MKKPLFILFSFALMIQVHAQNSPIDFEEQGFGASWTWTVFENDSNPPLEIIANPDMSGINTSATVAQFTALQLGNPWAGCETQHGSDIGSFFLDATNSTISIMVYKSVISDVGIKLVRADAWSLGEIKIANTLVNQWEEITFDFTSNEGNTFDQIVIFPDFDLDGREGDNIVYFDNISFNLPPNSVESIQSSPVSLVPNPSNHSVQFLTDRVIDEMRIYSLTGALVMGATPVQPGSAVDISSLEPGMYMVEMWINERPVVDRLVKSSN